MAARKSPLFKFRAALVPDQNAAVRWTRETPKQIDANRTVVLPLSNNFEWLYPQKAESLEKSRIREFENFLNHFECLISGDYELSKHIAGLTTVKSRLKCFKQKILKLDRTNCEQIHCTYFDACA